MSAAVASPKKAKPAAKKKAAPPLHPTYAAMASAAIVALADKKGSSRQAIAKHINANFKVGSNAEAVKRALNLALAKGVKSGAFLPGAAAGRKGAGAFKLAKKPAAKKAKKAKKPKAKKAKKVKKAKKPKVKKPKAKKPKAKVAKKKAAKKPAAKKPAAAAKKPAAKKAVKAKKPAAKKAKKAAKK